MLQHRSNTHPFTVLLLLAVMIYFAVPGAALAEDADGASIRKIHSRLMRFRATLNGVHDALKAEPASEKVFPVENAGPMDVYNILMTMYGKTDKLVYEQTGTRGDFFPYVDPSDIKPSDIDAVVHNAQKRLDPLLQKLETSAAEDAAESFGEVDYTKVYRAAFVINRKLNTMLARTTTEADIFRQLRWGVNYSKDIMALFPDAMEPKMPGLHDKATAADVYTQLIHIIRNISEVYMTSGFEVIEIPYAVLSDIEGVTNDDVYDLAAVVTSQLAFLRGRLEDKSLLPGVYYPGPKTVPEVYQQARYLKDCVGELYFLIIDDSWMKDS